MPDRTEEDEQDAGQSDAENESESEQGGEAAESNAEQPEEAPIRTRCSRGRATRASGASRARSSA